VRAIEEWPSRPLDAPRTPDQSARVAQVCLAGAWGVNGWDSRLDGERFVVLVNQSGLIISPSSFVNTGPIVEKTWCG